MNLTILFATFFGLVFVPVTLCVKLPLDALQSRQDPCEVYGDYPKYTGPYEDTSKINKIVGI